MSEFGRLRRLYEHNQLNPVTGGMAKSMGVNILYIEYPEKQPIELKAAVSLYNGGRSICGAQKASRKTQKTATAATQDHRSYPDHRSSTLQGC